MADDGEVRRAWSADVRQAASGVRRALGDRSFAGAVILGSGFGTAAQGAERVAYGDLPGFPACGVSGHAGEISVLESGDDAVLIFSGRVHAYESDRIGPVTFCVDLARALGARRLLLTCAAGGVQESLVAGSLVLVEDHLNLSGWTPSIEPHAFLDLGAVYDATWRQELTAFARRHGLELLSGVLACVRGPAYETPAEVRMLRALGADLVSMSTVPEAIRARALDMEVAALAVVANPAAGLTDAALRHADVLDRVRATVDARAPFLREAALSAARGKGDRVP